MPTDVSAYQFLQSNPYIVSTAQEIVSLVFPEEDTDQLVQNMHIEGNSDFTSGFACGFPDEPEEAEYVLFVPNGKLFDMETKASRLACLVHELVHLSVAWRHPAGAVCLTQDEHEALARSFELHIAELLLYLAEQSDLTKLRAPGDLVNLVSQLYDRGNHYPKRQEDWAYLLLIGSWDTELVDPDETRLQRKSREWLEMLDTVALNARKRAYIRGEQ